MMKKILCLFSVLIMPIVCFGANDACTKPSEYTVDKRCYVTDAQKKQKPYNAVVGLVDSAFIYCTGTIVKGKDGKPYLYTAKHCVVDQDYKVKSKLEIILQDGRELVVTKNNVGNHSEKDASTYDGDWAVYSINEADVPSVKETDKERFGFGPFTSSYNTRVVGYGGLKVMSDKEIDDFKQKYIKYLQDVKNIKSKGTEDIYGFYNGGVNTTNSYVINFLSSGSINWYALKRDNINLKVSNCEYSSNGKLTNCQLWSGNSGGPIFDDKGNIMGIMTRALLIIGGKNHAGSKYYWFDPATDSILLLK